ncbi:MAG: hypothetical protein DWG83_02055, partial [Chloroflexi bacterium]|nr:hypothetical protein [Chloroflexota bacterium]
MSISSSPISLAVFLGGLGGSPGEAWMRRVLEAAAFDAIEVAQRSGCVGAVVYVTDAGPNASPPAGVRVEVDIPGSAFAFGGRMVDVGGSLPPGAIAYFGGGSAPLLEPADFARIAEALRGDSAAGICVTNNRYSSDLFGLDSIGRLAALDPLPTDDNAIPRRLHEEQGVEVIELPRTLATQFNIDTPSDSLALAISGRGGPRLQAALDDPMADHARARMEAGAREFIDRTSEVLVAGRVSARTWRYLEAETACRIRLVSEERGMHAAGTEEAGTARSILGQWIALAGLRRAFTELLPEVCRAAFIDIRPALVQLALRPSRADRFAADLGRADLIEDAGLREIVEAAADSPVPVVLGGHSLVG